MTTMRKRGLEKMSNDETKRSTRNTLAHQYGDVMFKNRVFTEDILEKVLGEISRNEAIEAIKKNFCDQMDRLK